MLTYFRCVRGLFFGIMLFLSLLFIGGCSGGGTETGNPMTFPMPTFSSDAELETYLKDQYASNVLPKKVYYGGATIGGVVPPGEGDGGEFSQTNIQEPGVDEADKVKTDGTYLYVTGERMVRIIDIVQPEAMNEVSRIDIRGTVDSLHLYDDILIVLYTPDQSDGTKWTGTDADNNSRVGVPYWVPVNARTGMLLADVTDPSDPRSIRNVVADGVLVSSRVTGGKLHVIQQFLPDLPRLQLYFGDSEEEQSEIIVSNHQNLDLLTLDDLVPSYEVILDNGAVDESGPLVAPENFCHPDEPGGGSIVTVLTFPLDDLSQPFQTTGIVADAHVVYASERAIYVAATQWEDMPGSDGGSDWHQETIVHKFDLTGEKVRCVGSASIPGWVLNPFSIGEHEDVLRVATTTQNYGGSLNIVITQNSETDETPVPSNHVFCLQADNGKLDIIGRLEDIAPGERIYAARFIESRGYLVTFVKIDPLFTLDLSDPAAPRIVGELKVPGYSAYIHPIDDNHLLTIGKDVNSDNDTSWFQGMRLSVFDVSDFASPALLHKEDIGVRGTDSEALHNHKAFTFWKENGLLAIPVDLHEYEIEPSRPSASGTHTFSGLYVYRLTTADGFGFLGRISTKPASYQRYYHDDDWTRGIFVDESVYAVTEDDIRSASVEDVEATVTTLSLTN